jgi:hypothetical protein
MSPPSGNMCLHYEFKITEFLKESGDPYRKTIAFCVDQDMPICLVPA